MLKGKHIILGISGGIAAYKSAILLRLLVKAGAEVQVVITPAGKEFITPVTLSALSGKPVVSEFFTANSGEWHSHVDLGLWADLMVVAPATASTIAKMANGVADNMLITTYLSAKEKVMVAPAMDLDMWSHPSTRRNVATLKNDGVTIIEPGSGELASHLVGKGRMEEPERILKVIKDYFRQAESLKGEKLLVTAGPTFEDIDPVRFIGNSSSGKMGFAIAEEAAERGAEVTVVAGPVSVPLPSHPNIRVVKVRTASQMLEASLKEFENSTAAVLAAAVADYRPEVTADKKMKRERMENLEIKLVRNPDIAATLGLQKGDRKLVGFALETDHEFENALSKLKRKNLDAIVLNSLRESACFNSDDNKISILNSDGSRNDYPLASKRELAGVIIDTVFGK